MRISGTILLSTMIAACIGSTSNPTNKGADTGGPVVDSGSPDDECDTAVPEEEEEDAEALCAAGGTPQLVSADGFSRSDSNDLGSTETGGHAYVDSNSDGSGYIKIFGETLSIHYFAGENGSAPDQWVNIDRLPLADLEIEARLRTYDETYNALLGLSYRMPTQDGIQGRAGYHVFLEQGTLNLYAGHLLLDSAVVGDDYDWHTYRIVSIGDAHCVYRDDALVISARDDTFSDAGYIGAAAWYSIGYLDDLQVSSYETEPSGEGFAAWWEGGQLSGAKTLTADGPAAVELTFQSSGSVDAWVRGEDGLRLSIDSTGAALTAGGSSLASASLADDGLAHDWRLLAAGQSVRVYRDGILFFDALDETQLSAGSVGLEGSATIGAAGMRDLTPEAVYPAGSVFPVQLYSVSEVYIPQALSSGGRIMHSYGSAENSAEYVEAAGRSGALTLANVGTYYVDDADIQPISDESETRALIARMADGASVGWWTFPEELRFWSSLEMEELSNLRAWTREVSDAPSSMYIAGHYSAESIANYIDEIDIVGKGSYVDYAGQPRAWVRHQVESTVEAIELAGYTVGSDYLGSERVPLLIAGVWADYPATAEELYHDVYAGIAAGAKGISLFSYHHGLNENSDTGLEGFLQAAEELSGELGQAVLFGTAVNIGVEITSGATVTESFTPYSLKEMQYPCVNAAGWDHEGQRWVVVVNSCEAVTTALLSGLGNDLEVQVPLEGRAECLEEGTVSEDFDALGVHIYRIDAP